MNTLKEEFANYNNRAIPEGQEIKQCWLLLQKYYLDMETALREQLFYERSNDCSCFRGCELRQSIKMLKDSIRIRS